MAKQKEEEALRRAIFKAKRELNVTQGYNARVLVVLYSENITGQLSVLALGPGCKCGP